MPQVPVPDRFEEAILLRLHRSVMPLWQKLTIAAIGGSVILVIGYLFLSQKPEIVRVVRVPVILSPAVEVENIPPAPVHVVPVRSEKQKSVPVSKVQPQKRHGVAGY